jgi:purine-cytosine permease-like protein
VTFFFVVMGGIILMVAAVALMDWLARRKDRKSRPRTV